MRAQVSSRSTAHLAWSSAPVPFGTLQRKCACGSSANSGSGECEGCKKKKKTLERQAAGSAGPATAPPIVHEVLRSPGQSLDAATRTYMEPRFGHDFGKVRVHADSKAAESARSVNALAYTVGSDIVFAGGTPTPDNFVGARLLAHELTHVVQQSRASGASSSFRIGEAASPSEREADSVANSVVSNRPGPHPTYQGTLSVQRQPLPGPTGGDTGSPCDKDHTDVITKAEEEASGWVGKATKWIEDHRAHIKKRAPSGGDYKSVGTEIFGELQILEKHFKISEIIQGELHSQFPSSPTSDASFTDFNNWGRADFVLLQRLNGVKVTSLPFGCKQACPKGNEGAETLGSAVAGSGNFTIYTNCFDKQDPKTKTGVVLHEAFHASFSEFDHDTYSFKSDYPGTKPRTNAESFATFAAVAATGSDYRVIVVPDVVITGSPAP